jgi:hypothetical protein
MVVKENTQSGKGKQSFISKHLKESRPNSREKTIWELAGWLTHEEAEELNRAVRVFRQKNRRQ